MSTRLHIKPAASGQYSHSYAPISLLSMDFGELDCSRCVEVLGSDQFKKFKANGVVRLAPQDFPPYGKVFLKTAAFYVPEHQIIECSDAFHENMVSYKGKAVVEPHFYLGRINQICSFTGFSTLVTTLADPTTTPPAKNTYDFILLTNNSGSSSYKYYKLTYKGKQLYKFFKMLGYDFVSYSYNPNYNDSAATSVVYVNAFALLAYAKVYVDMFLNGVFYNHSELVSLLHAIHDGESFSDSLGNSCYDSSTGEITYSGLLLIFNNIFLPHESNMYTDAFNAPNSPDGVNPASRLADTHPSGLVSPYQYNPGTSLSPSIEQNEVTQYANRLGRSNNADLNNLSANGLRLLNAFDKFVRRWQLFGNKAVQRVYASFGIDTESFRTNYVHKLYEGAERIQFTPVLSTSNTENAGQTTGSPLGDYAGFGVSAVNIDFNYRATDRGYLVILHWLQIVPILMRGTDPMNLRRYAFDFYTAEYDGQGIRAIPYCEVSVDKGSQNPTTANQGDINPYGFTDLYDDYRNMRDVVAGEFLNGIASNFFFGRDLSVLRAISGMLPQSNGVHYYDRDGNPDLSNPFQFNSTVGDRFYLYLEYEIDAERPVKSKSEAINLNGEGNLSMPLNGETMQ